MKHISLGEFWEIVTLLCNVYNGRVSSGPRSEEQNKAVGGVPGSQHIFGRAADVVLGDWIRKAAFIQSANRLGLQVIDETTTKNHLHLQIQK